MEFGKFWPGMMRTVEGMRSQESEEEDRISALPDCLIRHILSLLPSTKQAIQTGILSKRWRDQWAHVPLLVFDSTGKSDQNFSQFIDRTLILHDCSAIKKFQIKYDDQLGSDPQIAPKLRFVARKHVEELVLHLSPPLDEEGKVDKNHWLPKFLFSNDSLVKLDLLKCSFSECWRADWPNLKELILDCSNVRRLIVKNILRGCPSLELLQITNSRWYRGAVIASKSLKKLSFIDAETKLAEISNCYVEISCPNLEDLCLKMSHKCRSRLWSLSDKTIDNVLSGSPFLHTLELSGLSCPPRLVIASKSLKKLVVGRLDMFPDLEILCPCLDEFQFYPSSDAYIDKKSLVVKILRQLQHVKVLHIGGWLIQTLNAEGSSSLSLNCKCLALELDGYCFDWLVSVISCSPLLEKLVIKFPPKQSKERVASPGLTGSRKKDNSSSDGMVINCSVSNLKTVEIIGLSEMDDSCQLLFNFVEYLLKNGRVLEKMVFVLGQYGRGFIFDVSKKLLSLPRSRNTIIELF